MKIVKAVIPVAGLGTRLLPATKAIPKEMLPIVDKPLIQYVVEECIQAGIEEIILVTHASKNSIENHFDTSFELETKLEQKVKRQLLESVQEIIPSEITIMHVRQGSAKGLGHAVSCARPIIGDSPFALILPDVIIDEHTCNLMTDNMSEMFENYKRTNISQIMVEEVPVEEVHKYGIVDLDGKKLSPGKYCNIKAMIEKPDKEMAPSNYAMVGRYILSPDIWDILDNTAADDSGEIQLTSALSTLLSSNEINAFCIQGKSHDCGSKLGLLKTNVIYGLNHKEISSSLKDFLQTIKLK